MPKKPTPLTPAMAEMGRQHATFLREVGEALPLDAPPPLPTMAEVICLFATKAARDLQRLRQIRDEDEENWCDADVAVEFATYLVEDKVKSLPSRKFATSGEFTIECYKCEYTLEVACAAFSRKDSHYFRALESVRRDMASAAELAEFVALEHDKSMAGAR